MVYICLIVTSISFNCTATAVTSRVRFENDEPDDGESAQSESISDITEETIHCTRLSVHTLSSILESNGVNYATTPINTLEALRHGLGEGFSGKFAKSVIVELVLWLTEIEADKRSEAMIEACTLMGDRCCPEAALVALKALDFVHRKSVKDLFTTLLGSLETEDKVAVCHLFTHSSAENIAASNIAETLTEAIILAQTQVAQRGPKKLSRPVLILSKLQSLFY